MFSSLPPEKPLCLVLPLEPYAKISKERVGHQDHRQECIIFDLALLKSIQPSLQNDPTLKLVSLEQLRIMHITTSEMLTIKDMPPFGKATFAKQTIPEGSVVVCAYYAITLKTAAALPTLDQAYLMACAQDSDDIVCDAKYVQSKVRYMQYLPDSPSRDGKQESLTANADARSVYVKITLDSETYILPVPILKIKAAKKDELVGWDYGPEYWPKLGLVPTYFNSKLEPMIFYSFAYCKNQKWRTVAEMNDVKYAEFIKNHYIKINNFSLILPKASEATVANFNSNLPKALQESVKINVPAVIVFERSDGLAVASIAQEEVLGIRLLPQLVVDLNKGKLNSLLYQIKDCIKGISHMDNDSFLFLSVNKLKNASLDDFRAIQKFISQAATDKDCMTLCISEPVLDEKASPAEPYQKTLETVFVSQLQSGEMDSVIKQIHSSPEECIPVFSLVNMQSFFKQAVGNGAVASEPIYEVAPKRSLLI